MQVYNSSFSQTVKYALDNKHVLFAVFVDLRSAYDLSWKDTLVLKLPNIGVH